MQLLAIVVRGGLLDLIADLLDATSNRLTARIVVGVGYDSGLVLGDNDLLGLAEVFPLDVLELDAEILGDHTTTGEDRDVLEHGLAAIAETRSLDGGHLQRATELVDHDGGQSLTLDILGNHEERAALLGNLLEDGQKVLHRADLLLVEKDHRILENRFHPLGIGHEVGGEVTTVEHHALDDFEGGVETLGLFNGDDAVLADLLHRLGDDLADLGVVVGGDGTDVGDLVATDRLRQTVDGLDGRSDGGLDSTLQLHRVGARGYVLGTLPKNRLGQNGRGGGAVSGDIGGLGSDLAHHLRTHVLERISQLDLFGDRHTVLGAGRRTELLFDNNITTFGAQGDLDGVGQLVDALQNGTARLFGVGNLLCSHVSNFSFEPWISNLQTALGRALASENRENLVFAKDDVLLVFDLDLAARVLADQHSVARVDVHGLTLPVFLDLSRAHGDDFGLLGLLFGGIGDDDSTPHLLLLLDPSRQDSIVQWSNVHRHFSTSYVLLSGLLSGL